MKRQKKVVYNVQCAHEEEHLFEKMFVIEEGSEQVESEVEAFCPFCDEMVTVTVRGKLVPDEELLRRFKLR